MVSWLEELERREARARERITELRKQNEELTTSLAEQEATVSRLEITRETMTEILSGDGPVTEPDGTAEPAESGGAAPAAAAEGFAVGSPVGVRLVPAWSAELGVEALPRAYADIVEVLADAVHPLRAHQLCSVLGLSTDKSKVEGFRSKLKRLRERGWVMEVSPGLFASRDAAGRERVPEPGKDSAMSRRTGEEEGSRS
ncbi:hypothetical protein OEIGOIKO_03400 [Streptomyces chrestomyceticus JCM 4735]|uniref:Uncharacterized protein n=1 Tax=Streptomyces chrestomyceticus JCM 4735 TaxID=1306181 RepID=A0A7U9KUJ8_9ACTN|nr:hypothetical protein [Streptomyces chrestomyceticus]GCD35654.1 hypothetical protein OEIGOIKO_03400 [Streptomyces chrestomyceticus JCM 4735]